jgi:hypothetical protein
MFILREIKEDVSFTPTSERILNHYLGREYEVVKYDSPFYNESWEDFELDHSFPELIDKKPLLSKEEFSILERDIKSNIFFIRAPERVKGQDDIQIKFQYITNLTRVYEEIKDQPILFKPQQTGEKKTTAEEVQEEFEKLSGSYVPKAIKDALGFLVSTYFVRNVPEQYDTPDYTVDDEIVNEIYDQLKETKISPEIIASLVNMYCAKYIRENY